MLSQILFGKAEVVTDFMNKGRTDLCDEFLFRITDGLYILLKEDYLVRKWVGYLKEPSFSGMGHAAEKSEEKGLPGDRSFPAHPVRIILHDNRDIPEILPVLFRQCPDGLFNETVESFSAYPIGHDDIVPEKRLQLMQNGTQLNLLPEDSNIKSRLTGGPVLKKEAKCPEK